MHWVSCLRQNVSATQVRYPSILILTLKNCSQTRRQRMWCSEVLQILLQAQHRSRQQLFDAEFPTLNETEIQAVKIVSQSPWHLCQAGSLTLINARGERVLRCYDETVVVV